MATTAGMGCDAAGCNRRDRDSFCKHNSTQRASVTACGGRHMHANTTAQPPRTRCIGLASRVDGCRWRRWGVTPVPAAAPAPCVCAACCGDAAVDRSSELRPAWLGAAAAVAAAGMVTPRLPEVARASAAACCGGVDGWVGAAPGTTPLIETAGANWCRLLWVAAVGGWWCGEWLSCGVSCDVCCEAAAAAPWADAAATCTTGTVFG